MYKLKELSLELTNSCPLACAHCSSGSSPEAVQNELDYDVHIRLIQEARELGATLLSLSGGTPLNYAPPEAPPNALVGLVRSAISIGYQRVLLYVTGHSTYGSYIIDYPYLDDLRELSQVTWIFSLHSHIPIVNDEIMRRLDAWLEINQSVYALVNDGENVEIHMVPMKPNFQGISEVRNMCRDWGVSKLSLLRFVPQTRGKDNLYHLAMSRSNFIETQILLHHEALKYHSVEIRLGCPIDFRHAIGLLKEKASPCHAGDDLMLVRPQGDVHPCAAWKSLPADLNVRNHSLRYIWENSDVFNTIRLFKTGKIMSWQGTLPGFESSFVPGYQLLAEGTCSKCNLLDSCRTGCLAQRLHAHGKGLAVLQSEHSDPLCPRGDW